MWYIKFTWTILVFMVLFSMVTGSCLEYGHSCWGAHGKRSGNTRAAVAMKQQPTAYVDNLTDQLFGNNNNNNNNNNNANSIDDENNKNFEAALTPIHVAPASEATAQEPSQDGSDAKWRQLLRQHRYQLRQMQRQLDANEAAESWRKLQQAMAEAEQQQTLQKQQQQPIGDFFELNK